MQSLSEKEMKIEINNNEYDVVITYKNIKNMYLRVKNDLKIYITCSKYVDKKLINKFINDNITSIAKALTKFEKQLEQNKKFMYLGKSYEIYYTNKKDVIFGLDKVFIGKNLLIDNYYKKHAKEIFSERLNDIYNLFDEDIPYPSLRIRKMTSRWGVCNVKSKTVTLNLELIKYDLKYLDYVIVHELSHLIYANHSKDFWNIISKYVPNYKKIRKEMKDFV